MPLALLAGSALGELDDAEEARVEEHVVSCDACAARYATFVRLGPAIAALVPAHRPSFVATPAVVARLEAEGLISRRYVIAPGSRVPCTVRPEDIYALTRLDADLSGISRLDLRRGPERYEDVPFDPKAGAVYLLTRSASLLPLPSAPVEITLLAIDRDGSERTLGDYTLDHTAYAAPD